MRAMVSIGSFDVPEPSTYTSTTATIVDSGRNAQAVTVGAVIRDSLAKVEMTWRFISAADWAALLSQFNQALGGKFYNSVTFFNQDTNDWETRTMYVSDRTSNVFTRNDDGTIRGYTDARIALVEA